MTLLPKANLPYTITDQSEFWKDSSTLKPNLLQHLQGSYS